MAIMASVGDTTTVAITGAMGTGLAIRPPICTRNPCMLRPPCTMNHRNRPVSVCFSHLIFVDSCVSS